MTARAHTDVILDAATVFAEGRLSAFKDAANILDGASMGLLTGYQRRRIDDMFERCAAKSGDAAWWRAECSALLALLAECEVNVPPRLYAKIREARSIVIHNAWLAQQGRPLDLPSMPPRDQLMARIHAYLIQFPDTDHAY